MRATVKNPRGVRGISAIKLGLRKNAPSKAVETIGKVACVFPCLDYTFVIGRLIEESLHGERQLFLCSYTEKEDA
jgi:hypothetical protein